MTEERTFTVDDVRISNGSYLLRQVCVPKEMPPTEAEPFLNVKSPCGPTHVWRFFEDLGEAKCAESPTRKHLLFRKMLLQ